MRIKQTILILAVVVALAGCGGSSNAPATSQSGGNPPAAQPGGSTATAQGGGGSAQSPAVAFGSGKTKEVQIIDPMFNMVVETMTIPANWDFEGTVIHGMGCKSDYWAIVYRMNSPDMKYGIQSIPQIDWYWAQDERAKPKGPACKDAPLMSAADYGVVVSQKMRPGSAIDKIEKSPSADAYAAATEKTNQVFEQQARQMGIQPMHQVSDCKRLMIHYDLNGQPEEEWLGVIMTVTMQPTPIIVSRPGEIMRSGTVPAYSTNVYLQGFRTPLGQMDASVEQFKAIANSTKVNQEYQTKLLTWMRDQNNRAIAASWQSTHSILQQGAAQGEALRQNAQRFIANMQAEGQARTDNFNASMQQKSAHAAEICDYLLDQQLFVNPTTGETSTQSGGAGHTFSNGGGGTVQSNNPSYNPNGMISGNWTELQPIHH